MKKIAIYGVGLIGGSLGMALRDFDRPSYKITGIGRTIEKLRLAKKLGAIDDYTTDIKEGVSKADIVIICTPVDLIAATVKKIVPYLKQGAVISDVGGVKGPVVNEAGKIVAAAGKKYKRSLYFVGAHPMAGAEKTGVQFADNKLYKNATVVLVKTIDTSGRALSKISGMWKLTGANLITTDPRSHDKVVSLISHLPHVIAFSLCLLARDMNKKDRQVSKYLAGSFKDLTRIAASNPLDWAAICKENKKELEISIDNFIKLLSGIKKRLKSKPATEKIFSEAKKARQKLLNI